MTVGESRGGRSGGRATWCLWPQGKVIRVPVCATFPLAGADAAYERFAGAKLGKVVLIR